MRYFTTIDSEHTILRGRNDRSWDDHHAHEDFGLTLSERFTFLVDND